jgi:exodeoxyribonuclease VII large subunit
VCSSDLDTLQGAFSDIVTNLQEGMNNLLLRLKINAGHVLELSAGELDTLKKKLTLLNPVIRIEQYKIKLLDTARQIFVRTGHLLKLKQAQFNTCVEKLSSLSPLNILSRGYSITFKIADGAIIKEASSLKAGDSIQTRLHKGEVISVVKETKVS